MRRISLPVPKSDIVCPHLSNYETLRSRVVISVDKKRSNSVTPRYNCVPNRQADLSIRQERESLVKNALWQYWQDNDQPAEQRAGDPIAKDVNPPLPPMPPQRRIYNRIR